MSGAHQPSPREPHAITRARERYGLELTHLDLQRLERDCAEGRSLVLGRWHDGTGKHAVLHDERALIVVIGPDGRAKTVLPRSALRLRRSGS
jgi:hypothetical protein